MFSKFTFDFQNKKSINSKKLFSSSLRGAFPSKDDSESSSSFYWMPEYLKDAQAYEHDYHLDWRKYLLRNNSEEVHKSKFMEERFTFYSPNIVKSVFNVCDTLKQPPEVRYLAVDILDRFLVRHFFEVAATFEEMEEQNLIDWEEVFKRMLDQSLLRILTCVQLAIKYSSTYNVMTAESVQEVMDYLRHTNSYSKKTIIKSEARIYKCLHFNIPGKTPLTYLEMFFEGFQEERFFFIKIPTYKFLKTCVHVLDITITYHKQVYSDLVEFMESSENPSDSQFCASAFKADFVILAASVIFAAANLEDPDTHLSEILLESLCSVGECRKSYIQVLGKKVLNVILDEG